MSCRTALLRLISSVLSGAVAILVFTTLTYSGAFAQNSQHLTLHPSGFGTHSYAAWKAQQGEPDTTGNANQALYFQKMTVTGSFAAGVAVIKGVAGAAASELAGLAWDHREDGHCGAGAPRWNLALQDGSGHQYTVFLGCYAAQHMETNVITNGFGWCRDTQSVPAAITSQTGVTDLSTLTITGLAILFDEGNDTANPPPAPCAQQGLAGGFVFLDNIEVDFNGVTYCWTSASNNGNGDATGCPGSSSALTTDTSLVTISPLAGIAVDPSDLDLVNGLNLVYPDVPITSWSLYPYTY
ncbi:MAG TPA: hypothetical protein VFQ00_11475 [Terriglobales bacterium]|nr:hypothetical protein [Terriglobales bacterium]